MISLVDGFAEKLLILCAVSMVPEQGVDRLGTHDLEGMLRNDGKDFLVHLQEGFFECNFGTFGQVSPVHLFFTMRHGVMIGYIYARSNRDHRRSHQRIFGDEDRLQSGSLYQVLHLWVGVLCHMFGWY